MAAGKKLKEYRFKAKSSNGTLSDISVNREIFLVHPNFRINSYDKRRFLINNVAIVAIKTDKDQESIKINLDIQSDMKTSLSLMVIDSFGCDKRGLSESQQCFKSKVKRKDSKNKYKGTYSKGIVLIDGTNLGEMFEHIQFDPREGYYASSCLYKSGDPIFDDRCHLVAMSLLSNCEESIIVALNLNNLKKWIRIAITTDIIRNQKWKKHKFLKRLFLNELKEGDQCGRNFYSNQISEVTGETTHSTKTIQTTPTFKRLSENLRVITSCGVEVRLNAGIIHSPIHYRDIQDSKELLALFQKDYRYRPNQKCQWVITAPNKCQKVGIQFKYFYLDPEYDRLEIEVNLDEFPKNSSPFIPYRNIF